MNSLLIALTSFVIGVQGSSPHLALERSEAPPKNAQIAGWEDTILYATQGLRGEDPTVGQFGNVSLPRWNPFEGRPDRHRIRDIAVSGSAEVFMAYSQQSREFGWMETRFAKIDYGKRVVDIWATDEVWVESFSVSSQGFYYVLGLPRDAFLALGKPGATGSQPADLLHIFDSQFRRVGSLIPQLVTAENIGIVRQLLRESTISVRPDGNFFVTLAPITSQLVNSDLASTSQEIVEYDPQGKVVRVHHLPEEDPRTPVSAVIPNDEGGLVVQLARFQATTPRVPHPGGPVEGHTAFIMQAPTVVTISADGERTQVGQLQRGETLLSVGPGGSTWNTVRIAPGPATIRNYRRFP